MPALASLMSPVLAQNGGTAATFLPLIILVLVFYLLLIRPQQKRAKQQRELVASVQAGDRVVSLGGIHGTVKFVDEDVIHLEVSPGTTITLSKQAVARKVVDAETGAGE
jgi:preprotein translocase subunit YajC